MTKCSNCGMELDSSEIFDVAGVPYCEECHDFELEKLQEDD